MRTYIYKLLNNQIYRTIIYYSKMAFMYKDINLNKQRVIHRGYRYETLEVCSKHISFAFLKPTIYYTSYG